MSNGWQSLARADLVFSGFWQGVGWTGVALVWYASLMPSPPDIGFAFADKVEHALAYAALMAWFGQLARGRFLQGIYAVGLVLMGIAIEFAQGATGYRSFELMDMLADAVGVALGWGLTGTVFAGWLVQVDGLLARWRSTRSR